MKANLSLRLFINKLFFILLLCFFVPEVYSDTQIIKKDTAYVRQLIDESFIKENSREKKRDILSKALEISKEEKYLLLQARIHHLIGESYITDLDSSKIFYHFNKSKNIYHTLDISDNKYAKLLLDYSFAYDQLKYYSEALNYARKALKYTENGSVEAHIFSMMSASYINIGDYDKGLSLLLQAADLAQNNNNQAILSQANTNLGVIYIRLRDYDKALQYLEKSLQWKIEKNDLGGQIRVNLNIGNAYFHKGKHPLAFEYYQKALIQAKQIDDHIVIPMILGNLGSVSSQSGNHKDAIDYYHEALKASVNENHTTVFNNLGNEYFAIDNYKAALYYYQKAYDNSIKFGELENIKSSSQRLSEYYSSQRDFEKAYEYQQIYIQTKDSLLNIELIKNIENIKTKHDQEIHKNQIEILEKNKELNSLKLERNKKINWSLAIILVLLMLLIGLIYSRYISNKRTTEVLLQQQKLIHDQEKQVLEADQENLKHQLAAKNMELTTHIIKSTEKNEYISQTIHELQKIKSDLSSQKTKEINQLIKRLKENSNENIWKEFDIRFNEIQKDFYDKLNKNFPDLSAAERRLCAFLRLDMTTKEIAHITHKSPAGIDTARSRLRKKLNISDSNLNLSSFLSQL